MSDEYNNYEPPTPKEEAVFFFWLIFFASIAGFCLFKLLGG